MAAGELAALTALYQATGGPNWVNHAGWLVPGTLCVPGTPWHGVRCNSGSVTELNLGSNGLNGCISLSMFTALPRLKYACLLSAHSWGTCVHVWALWWGLQGVLGRGT